MCGSRGIILSGRVAHVHYFRGKWHFKIKTCQFWKGRSGHIWHNILLEDWRFTDCKKNAERQYFYLWPDAELRPGRGAPVLAGPEHALPARRLVAEVETVQRLPVAVLVPANVDTVNSALVPQACAESVTRQTRQQFCRDIFSSCLNDQTNIACLMIIRGM